MAFDPLTYQEASDANIHAKGAKDTSEWISGNGIPYHRIVWEYPKTGETMLTENIENITVQNSISKFWVHSYMTGSRASSQEESLRWTIGSDLSSINNTLKDIYMKLYCLFVVDGGINNHQADLEIGAGANPSTWYQLTPSTGLIGNGSHYRYYEGKIERSEINSLPFTIRMRSIGADPGVGSLICSFGTQSCVEVSYI